MTPHPPPSAPPAPLRQAMAADDAHHAVGATRGLVREAGAPYRDERAGSLDALVRCARGGDPLAFRSVAERLGPPLVRFVMRFTGQDNDFANDVVQDALVAAWRNLDGIRDDGHIRPWLYRVARFKAVDRLRKRGPGGVAMASLDIGIEMEVEPLAPSHMDPADATHGARSAMRRAMRRALASLPPRYIGAVRLHYMHGMPVGETARLLGLPKPAVKMRLHRARRRLRRFLRGELPRVEPNDKVEGATDGPITT